MADYRLTQTGQQVQNDLNNAERDNVTLAQHVSDAIIHVTEANKTAWNAKYNKPGTGIPKSDLASAVQTAIDAALTAYQKPGTGIPKSDLASAVQTAIDAALTAYQKPGNGIPKSDLASAVQTALEAALTAYQKPNTGIPATDLSAAVQSALNAATGMQESIDAERDARANADLQLSNIIGTKITSEQASALIASALTAYSTTSQMNSAIASALTSYYTKTQTDNLLADKQTAAQVSTAITNALASYYTKTAMDAIVAGLQTKLTFDQTPTRNSGNPVTSEGIRASIATAVNGLLNTSQVQTLITNALASYSTTSEVANAISTALADYSTTTQVGTMISTAINTALAQYYNKTQVDNIANTKTDKLTMTGAGAAVEDDIMVIDENGNIKDGGKKISDLQLKVTDCAMLGGGFPTCTTAGGTAAKTVSIPHFLLLPNCRISVLFQNAFTATNPTLSINSGAAIAIRHFGRAIEIGKVHANTILTMVYDGTYWQVVGIEGITGSTPSGAIDLALPSGLLWCEHNVGAASPYDDGLYFSWGNITGHTGDDGYDFGTSNDGPYASTPGAALTGDIPAGNDYDAARHNMGVPWRMPTVGEFQELNAQCDSEWTDEDGVAGRRFTSRINGNSIFFPASGYRNGTGLYRRGSYGYYRSASLDSQANGYILYFYSGGVRPASNYDRFVGFSVRAVQ